jgi:hypothetical protein
MLFSRPRQVIVTFVLVCTAFVLGACERSTPATGKSATSTPPESSAALPRSTIVSSAWENAAGPVLLVEGGTRDEALVLLPTADDSATVVRLAALGESGADVLLLGRGGERFTGQLGVTPNSTDTQCRLWPLRAVRDAAGSNWAVGFIGGQVTPLPLDSVDLLTSRDSMALAAEASRLASAVTATTTASFQGLRFVAHDIRRFEASPGVQAIVAHLFRRVNQEADPQEEQTLLVAERDSGATSGPYQLAYAERAHGLEEEVPTPEVIAAVHLAGRPTLIIARDSDTGVAYSMLERTGVRQWRIRWTSALTRCD